MGGLVGGPADGARAHVDARVRPYGGGAGPGRRRPGTDLDRRRRHHQVPDRPADRGGGPDHHRLREQHGDRQHHGDAAHVDVRRLRSGVQQRRPAQHPGQPRRRPGRPPHRRGHAHPGPLPVLLHDPRARSDAGHPRGERGHRRGHHRASDGGPGQRGAELPGGVRRFGVRGGERDRHGRLGCRADRVRDRRHRRLAAVHHARGDRSGRRPQGPLPRGRQGGQHGGREERRVHRRRPADGRHDGSGDLGDGGRGAEPAGRLRVHGDGHRLRVGHRLGGQHRRVRAR